jgi:hypothetical protein
VWSVARQRDDQTGRNDLSTVPSQPDLPIARKEVRGESDS